MAVWERAFIADTRAWIGSRARGRVLEVAVGTGLNLPHYPPEAEVTGIDFSPAMLAIARKRAAELGRPADLHTGSAELLAFPDAAFDTVVCTFALCAIPDERRAVAEMVRVLHPEGRLLLADHVVADNRLVRVAQRAVEWYSVPRHGEHFRRRPFELVLAAGLRVDESDRLGYGMVERLVATTPPAAEGGMR